MPRRPRALIVYASTSGSTIEVARLFGMALPAIEITQLNLGTAAAGTSDWCDTRYDVILAGTPTYGQGDWHSAWERRKTELAPVFRSADSVMLFALGDARSHGATFAGGLGPLLRFGRAAGARITGFTAPTNDAEAACPAIQAGQLPGLCIQYRRQRHGVGQQIERWLSNLPAQWRDKQVAE